MNVKVSNRRDSAVAWLERFMPDEETVGPIAFCDIRLENEILGLFNSSSNPVAALIKHIRKEIRTAAELGSDGSFTVSLPSGRTMSVWITSSRGTYASESERTPLLLMTRY